jgi:hypothetical protein
MLIVVKQSEDTDIDLDSEPDTGSARSASRERKRNPMNKGALKSSGTSGTNSTTNSSSAFGLCIVLLLKVQPPKLLASEIRKKDKANLFLLVLTLK